MFRKLKDMLAFISRKHKVAEPDAISTQVANAIERNEKAGEQARLLLIELLDANDKKRGLIK